MRELAIQANHRSAAVWRPGEEGIRYGHTKKIDLITQDIQERIEGRGVGHAPAQKRNPPERQFEKGSQARSRRWP